MPSKPEEPAVPADDDDGEWELTRAGVPRRPGDEALGTDDDWLNKVPPPKEAPLTEEMTEEQQAELDEMIAAKKLRGDEPEVDVIIPWGEPLGPGDENLRHLEDSDDDE